MEYYRCLKVLYYAFNGTASIKMREIDISNVKDTNFTCSLVIN